LPWRRDLGRRAPDGCGLGDCIAVIGDGSISAGMAYEAMNNAGHLGTASSSSSTTTRCRSPPVGAMSAYLCRLYAGEPFQDFRAAAKSAVSLLPPPLREAPARQGCA
jgi:1-deoxy-D-xylulose-5-phosphate synthase